MNNDASSFRLDSCANCGAKMDAPYCGTCGQNWMKGQRLATANIVQQFLSTLVNTDSAFWVTFFGMASNPGRVCCDYVAGKRQKYVSPFVYVLIVATAQLIFAYVLIRLGWKRSVADEEDLPAEVFNVLLFLVSLVIALLLTRLFSGSRRNFAETYSFTLFLVGQLLWVDFLCMPIFAIDGTEPMEAFVMPTAWIVLTTWAGVPFFGYRRMATLWRVVLALALALGFLFGVVMALAFAVASWNSTAQANAVVRCLSAEFST